MARKVILLIAIVSIALMPIHGVQASAQTLGGDLLSCWEMDETISTARADTTGSYPLTDSNTVARRSGLISNAAYVVAANSESLYNTTAGKCLLNQPQTITMWVNMYSYDGAGTNLYSHDAELLIQVTSTHTYVVSKNPTSGLFETILTMDELALNQWNFLVVLYDPANDYVAASVNNGALTEGSNIPDHNCTVTQLTIANRLTGLLDVTSKYSGLLDEDERSWLYNDGRGRSCAQIISPPTTIDAYTSNDSRYTIKREISFGDMAVIACLLIAGVPYVVVEVRKYVDRKLP